MCHQLRELLMSIRPLGLRDTLQLYHIVHIPRYALLYPDQ